MGNSRLKPNGNTRTCRYCGQSLVGGRSNRSFCSDAHRVAHHRQELQLKDRRKAVRLQKKLERLAASKYGRWLGSQLRRSGTVQALQGHSAESLKELAVLCGRCTKLSGYVDGAPQRAFEVSHIVPCGPRHEQLGLVHPKNLVIAPKDYNRRRGSKVPDVQGAGLSIPRSQLLRRWRLTGSESNLQVLTKAKKFLGSSFTQWLKGYTLQIGQEEALKRSLLKAEAAPELVIQRMQFEELRELADSLEVDYFHLNSEPAQSLSVLISEAKRLGLASDALSTALLRLDEQEFDLVEEPEWAFQGDCLEAYTDFIEEQVLHALHGHVFSLVFEGSDVLSFWSPKTRNEEVIANRYELEEDIL